MDHETSQRNRRVAIWLLVMCGLVFAMVVLGGVTRLTGSGLSMVDWRPVTGVLPPLSDDDWQRAFDLYRQSPEFREINAHMDVGAFKGIFWLEYLHRLLGRLIGIAFVVPFAIFVARGYIARAEWPRYTLMFLLGGLQGLLGWYMVKSGLVDLPHVSHYRLTAHLVAAFVIYAYMLWIALSLLFPKTGVGRHAWFGISAMITALISVTAVSGGFVAGLKAGKIFNTFPMMGDYWIPPGVLALEPAWRNFFDNPATVQLDHRALAITTFLAVVVFRTLSGRQSLSPRARSGLNWLFASVVAQLALGILTLLWVVPTALAATHQAVAMLVFTASLFLVHALREPGPTERQIRIFHDPLMGDDRFHENSFRRRIAAPVWRPRPSLHVLPHRPAVYRTPDGGRLPAQCRRQQRRRAGMVVVRAYPVLPLALLLLRMQQNRHPQPCASKTLSRMPAPGD
ncbi:MAG: COX15/CtaA family protein [Woeseiaceae bacterium]